MMEALILSVLWAFSADQCLGSSQEFDLDHGEPPHPSLCFFCGRTLHLSTRWLSSVLGSFGSVCNCEGYLCPHGICWDQCPIDVTFRFPLTFPSLPLYVTDAGGGHSWIKFRFKSPLLSLSQKPIQKSQGKKSQSIFSCYSLSILMVYLFPFGNCMFWKNQRFLIA